MLVWALPVEGRSSCVLRELSLPLQGQHYWRPGEDSDLAALKYGDCRLGSEEVNAGWRLGDPFS